MQEYILRPGKIRMFTVRLNMMQICVILRNSLFATRKYRRRTINFVFKIKNSCRNRYLSDFWCHASCIYYKLFFLASGKWAATRQNEQNDLWVHRRHSSVWASTQSDQSSLSAWRKNGSLAIHKADKDWSDVLKLRLICLHQAHRSFCWFCHALAQMYICAKAMQIFFWQMSYP